MPAGPIADVGDGSLIALRVVGGAVAFGLFYGGLRRYARRDISRLSLILTWLVGSAIIVLAASPSLFNPLFATFDFQRGNQRQLIATTLAQGTAKGHAGQTMTSPLSRRFSSARISSVVSCVMATSRAFAVRGYTIAAGGEQRRQVSILARASSTRAQH